MNKARNENAAFSESLAQAEDYPMNLLRTDEFHYKLEKYKIRLWNDTELFYPSHHLIAIRDLPNTQNIEYIHNRIDDMKQLQNALDHNSPDPCRRFIFIRSANSRRPLLCTPEQLTYLFTYHQIMPSFLDFVFTFGAREKPHSFTSFRYENYLNRLDEQPELNKIGRSGIQIQHCFNLLGIEENERNKGEWLQRQVASYHSFDLVQHRALWVIIKGNNVMQDRVTAATSNFANNHRIPLDNIQDSFAQTLKDLTLLLQWSVENWDLYLQSIESDYRHFSSITKQAPIEEWVGNIPANRNAHRITTLSIKTPTRKNTSDSKADLAKENILRRLSTFSTKINPGWTFARSNSMNHRNNTDGSLTPKAKNLGLDNLVSFDQLQNLSRLDKQLDEAVSIIDQNKRVLADIKDYYAGLVNLPSFESHMPDCHALKVCQESVSDFVHKVSRLEGDLDNYQVNLKTTLRSVEKMGVLFNNIIQYHNNRTAEYFANSSEESTDMMRAWTKDMHQKTISMHLITVFTLLFLPGTFVATIFSSGILSFGEDDSAGIGSNMGDWKVRLAALKLFLTICLPLMALMIFGWIAMYWVTKVRRTKSRSQKASIEEGIFKEKETVNT